MKNITATARWLILLAVGCPLACAPSATPNPPLAENVAASGPGPVGMIEEISLERLGHRSEAPLYKVVLSKDGVVTYTGLLNVQKIGTFRAKIDPRDFHRLEEMIDRLRFFEMKDAIFVADDVDSVTTSAIRNGQRKTIEDGSGSNAPVELWTIEMAIDGLVANVTDWKQAEPVATAK